MQRLRRFRFIAILCVALLACCNSATGAQAALKAQCLTAYNMAMPMGDSACGTVLSTIKQADLI